MPDILAARKKNNEFGKDARERYSKHVRAIFQVGDKLSDDYKRPLNYPVEIIPQQNPYSLKVGQTIQVLCLLNGKPVANQFVIAGWESNDGKLNSMNARTDARHRPFQIIQRRQVVREDDSHGTVFRPARLGVCSDRHAGTANHQRR